MKRSGIVFVWRALTVLAIVELDQIVKAAARHLWLAAEAALDVPLIPGVLSFTYAENRGAILGSLWGKVSLLTLLMAAAILLVLCLLFRRWPRHPLGVWALVLFVGGALGNFIDRVAAGYVVDMFLSPAVSFVVFNVADVFILAGCVLFVVYMLRFHGQEGGKKDADAAV